MLHGVLEIAIILCLNNIASRRVNCLD